MQIGFNVPTSGPLATPDAMIRIAVEGEAMGFDYATVSDHIVLPRNIDAKYPYTETGEFPGKSRNEWQEQLTASAFLLAKTSRLRILTSVMVVPYRPALFTAKILSTIDVMSGGRISVGCGAGWMREEFEAVNAPPYEARGAVTDEFLQAFVELWTKESPRFEGKYARFEDIVFAPKPVQKPHPPIWIGGESGPALRRAVRFGGWYPIGANPQHLLDTLPRLTAGIERVRKMAKEAGRSDIPIGFRSQRHGTKPDAERKLFQGSSADIAADLHALEKLGVECVDFSFATSDLDTTLAAMRDFKQQVLSSL